MATGDESFGAARLPAPAAPQEVARAAIYATIGVVYAGTWLMLWGNAPPATFALVAAGFVCFALLQVCGDVRPSAPVSTTQVSRTRLCLAGQVLVGFALSYAVPGNVTWMLYFVSTVRAFATLSPREASAWSLALVALVAARAIQTAGLQMGSTMALVYAGGFVFFGAVIVSLRHVQAAREQSDRLLRELGEAHAQLRRQAAGDGERARELTTLLAISRSVASTLETEPLVGTILDQLKLVVEYSAASVRLLDGGELVMLSYRGPNRYSWRRARMAAEFDPLNHAVLQRRAPLVVGDTHTDPSEPACGYRAVTEWQDPIHAHVRSWLGVPLLVRDEAIGLIVLNHRHPSYYTPHHAALAQAFANHAAVAIDNAQLYGRAQAAAAREQQRAEELDALYRADAQLHRHLHLDQVLRALVDVAAALLRADKSAVFVWDDAHERLIPGACRGFSPETVAQMAFAPGEGVTGLVAVTGEPVVVEDALSDPRVARWVIEREQIHSFLQVPIKIREEVFGTFCVNYAAARRFTGDDTRLLLALAQRAAMAIENARLYGQAQQAAALEERQRLARELHDAVTQTLFSASLIAEVLPRMWERDPLAARARLEELRQLTRGALAEMRALLLELRPAALTEAPLPELLRLLTDAAAGRARMPVALEVEGDAAGEPLPAEAQVALYRIAQEALHNVAKHAGARRATVGLRFDPDGVTLRVEDDGVGFDPDAVSAERLGVRIMHERAAAIGAALQVKAAPGHGAQVSVVWRRAAGAPPQRVEEQHDRGRTLAEAGTLVIGGNAHG